MYRGSKKIKFMHDVENIKKPMTFIYQLNTIESSCIESLKSNANMTVVKKGKNNTHKSRRIIIFMITMFLFIIVQG